MAKIIETKEGFAEFVKEVELKEWYRKPIAFGICRINRGKKDPEKVLQATYPLTNWGENSGSAAVLMQAVVESGHTGVNFKEKGSELVINLNKELLNIALAKFNPYLSEAKGDDHKNVQLIKALEGNIGTQNLNIDDFKLVFIFEDANPESVEVVYLKLYALSQGKAKLRSLNLNGAFGVLHNVVWSGNTPIELDWLRENEMMLKLKGEYPTIDSVDKFPRFLQHVIPADNTRILDTAKVRFGAQLAAGTTVMPGASYINFNAGTLGPVMVEGRISSSAIVGAGSDVGGGASILGVLSGTDGNPISIGENTLLGANSTCGIPLGDGCIIDGGLAIFAGTKLSICCSEVKKLADANPDTNIFDSCKDAKCNPEKSFEFKAAELAGLNGLHFRQDSISGQYTVMRSTREVKLNSELH